jgi:hypothetical protein
MASVASFFGWSRKSQHIGEKITKKKSRVTSKLQMSYVSMGWAALLCPGLAWFVCIWFVGF